MSTLATVKDWVRRLGSEDHGLCILHNFFARERRFGLLDKSVWSAFFDRLDKHISSRGYLTEPKRLIQDVSDLAPPQFLAGRQITTPSPLGKVSRVVTTADLNDHYGGRLGLVLGNDRTDQTIAAHIEAGRIQASDLDGMWRGARPLCWVTQMHLLEQLRRSLAAPAFATSLRNRLGKRGWEDEHVYLVQVNYDEPLAAGLRTPTVLDGGGCVYFRPHLEADQWGRAVDLEDFGPGLPEAIHGEIPVSSSFALRSCGSIKSWSPGGSFRMLLAKSRALLR